MTDQMPSDLRGMEIKFNTTQPITVYNFIKTQIIP